MKRENILFVGELYPQIVHGISISNSIICEILRAKANLFVIEERSKISSIGSPLKVFNVLQTVWKIYSTSRKRKFSKMYIVLSLGGLGLIKSICYVVALKANNTDVTVHLHRGDFDIVWKNATKRLLMSILFRRVINFICLTPNQKSALEKDIGHFDFNIEYLENTILDEDKFLSSRKEVSNNPESVLFLSNFFEEKGVLDFIETAGTMPDVSFNLIGGNREFLFGLDIPSNVNVFDGVIGAAKISVFQSNSIMVLPSWNEGQPLVLIEAMAAGIPIVTTNVGLIPETLGEDYPFLVKPRNPVELGIAINQLLKGEEYSQTATKLLERYHGRFSNSVHKKRLLEIFNL